MYQLFIEGLQRLGRALMLPIAILPIAGLLLRLIDLTCQGAARHGRWVGVCGALASDPLATSVLIGLGVSELSVSAPQVGEIKERVRQLDSTQCRAFSQQLLGLSSAHAVRQACRDFDARPLQPRHSPLSTEQ